MSKKKWLGGVVSTLAVIFFFMLLGWSKHQGKHEILQCLELAVTDDKREAIKYCGGGPH